MRFAALLCFFVAVTDSALNTFGDDLMNLTIPEDIEISKDERGFASFRIGLYEVNVTSTGGIAKASTSHGGGNHNAIKAFDGSSYWHSGDPYTVLPQFLWVEFLSPIKIAKYSFTGCPCKYAQTDGPSKYIFWASNDRNCRDESKWVILKEDYSGTPFTKSNDPKEEITHNKESFRCYGFKVIDVPGRDGIKPVNIANVHFYAMKEVCNTGKKCGKGKGACIPSTENCNGRIVKKRCGDNCICCIKDEHEEVDWPSLIIPHPTTTKMSWIESWYRCQSMGAQPFVPRTPRDFQVIKSVRLTIGYLWVPASDLAEEGVLKWWNGEDAAGAQGLVWHLGEELQSNSDGYDCAIYGAPEDGVHIWDCAAKWFPMICYKNK